MQSFSDLNNYSATSTEYEDLRDFDIIFDRDTPTTPSTVSINEGITHNVPIGIEILDIINYDQSLLTVTFDLRNLSGATATFPTRPSYLTLDNSTSGLYIISGFKSVGDWDIIKSPVIGLPNAYYGVWQYTVDFDYFNSTGAVNKNYIVTVDVANVDVFTDVLDDTFNISSSKTLLNTPRIIDNGVSSPTYTVTVTPSNTANVTTLAGATATGATSSFNNTSKVLTITGTLAGVNTILAGITFTSTATEADFTFTYIVTNNLNAETDAKIQHMKCLEIQYLSVLGATSNYYNEDTAVTLTGLPTITDVAYDGTGTYTYTVTPQSTASVSTFSSTGSGGTSSFNSSTKVLTITGTRTQVNSHLTNVIYTPAADYASNTVFSYKIVTPRGSSATATKSQQILIGSQDTEITNMNITRTYNANNINTLFSSSVPYISDADVTNPTYTIFLSCGFGQFAVGSTTPAATYSYTGTKTQVNAIFPTIKFYPNKGVYGTGTFSYSQYKNSVLQVSQLVQLNGTNTAWSGNNTAITYNSSGTWTPTDEQLRYGGYVDIILVGGGGGGAAGGGAGGSVTERHNIAISSTTYTLSVGRGGAAAPITVPSGSFNYYGTAGTGTTGFGYSANGGAGGRRGLTIAYPTSTIYVNGGSGTVSSTDYPSSVSQTNTGGTGQATGSYLRDIGGGTYVTTYVSTGGGGSGASRTGTEGNGTSGSASGYTFTRSTGGAALNGYAGGGQGGTVRTSGTSPSTSVIENSTGAQGTGPGGGGGGAYGQQQQTVAYPTAGTNGCIVITVHS